MKSEGISVNRPLDGPEGRQNDGQQCDAAPTWIFGYGSLVWRPDFPYFERVAGSISGWRRRFWQGSTDHRGVPGAPGRVVTLEPAPGERCGGVAYRLVDKEAKETLELLDVREQGGYTVSKEPCVLVDGRTVETLLYVATPENPNFLGESSTEDLVQQIVGSSGPSGSNVEYVLELAAELERMGFEDCHVRELASAVEASLEEP